MSTILVTPLLQTPSPILPAAMKANHRADVVRIKGILPHPDPETTNLELILIGEYQVVVRKGEHQIGDLAVYIQPDSVVPQTEPFKFIWETFVGLDGTVPEKRRRITVRKFRGQWSEGLLLPVADLGFVATGANAPYEGEDVSALIGISHYDPDAGKEAGDTCGKSVHAPKRKRPTTLKGWFHFLLFKVFGRGRKDYFASVNIDVPEYDVNSLKNYGDVIREDEIVVVTEKIHGSNARYTALDGVVYAGSRTKWKSEDSPCVWRKALVQNQWIAKWCLAHEGYVLYGEVAPTQGKFDYGCTNGQVKFFLFDIRTPDGKWVNYVEFIAFDNYSLSEAIQEDGTVPTIYIGPYNRKLMNELASGQSLVHGAKHIREGIVIKPEVERRVPGLGRVQLKLVSPEFLAKDSK